jgi:biopolymer transport protein ExbB
MILQKMRQLARMGVDSPAAVSAFLDLVAKGDTAQAEIAVRKLRRSTRELFAAGLRYTDQPKTILEERLQAVLLEQRIDFERRLPLLAVIATASPLMGLLGTVVGMVKTFALISVFGTGNAGKLSGGISEVLISTELGLAVAIPTLVAHGFLAQRIHRNLSVQERYALQFATAVGTAQALAGADRGPAFSK